jgi:hypothetical protein
VWKVRKASSLAEECRYVLFWSCGGVFCDSTRALENALSKRQLPVARPLLTTASFSLDSGDASSSLLCRHEEQGCLPPGRDSRRHGRQLAASHWHCPHTRRLTAA